VNVFFRSFIVWLLIVLAEVIHGAIRGIFLVPVVGDFRARQIGVFTGSAIILLITIACIRWIRPTGNRQLLAIGLFWLFLMIGFEVSFGRFVMGLTWERIISDYNMAEGGLLPIGMLVLTTAPLVAAKVRNEIINVDAGNQLFPPRNSSIS
jgi:hypothetical protein